MKTKITRFLSGSFEEGGEVDQKTGHLDKKVMMVYTGKFESMDGPVEIKDEDIHKLVSNHNAKLAKLTKMASGELALKHSPPIQLDHSTSARDTVGRLVGDLTVGQYQPEGGVAITAMYGTARFIGKDNIEKVQDGRWSHVSMGADLEHHALSELSITPFPAAADAALLSTKRLADKSVDYKGKKITVKKDPANDEEFLGYVDGKMVCSYGDVESCIEYCQQKIDKGSKLARFGRYKGHDIDVEPTSDGRSYYALLDGEDVTGNCKTEAEAEKKAKSYLDELLKNYADDDDFKAKLKKRLSEDKMGYKDMKEKMAAFAKCKAHLMDEQKMSEEDAEKHLETASDEDVKKMSDAHDEKMSKMAKEEAEEKDKELKRMAGYKVHKDKLIALSKGMKEQNKKIQLANVKMSITSRLSKLRADGKVTPAEIKAMDIDKLSAATPEVVDATLKTFAGRQPVIDTGLVGSTKALTAGQLSGRLKKMQMEREELQTRLNMPSKRAEAEKRLAEVDKTMAEAEKLAADEHVAGGEAAPDVTAQHEKLWGEMKAMMDAGKHEEAKEHLKKHLAGVVGPDQGLSDGGAPLSDPTPQMSALADGMKKMQTDFDEVLKLTSPIFDIKPEELV